MALTGSSKLAKAVENAFSGIPTVSREKSRTKRRSSVDHTGYLWIVPGIAMLFALFIAPIALIVRDSFTDPTFGWQNYVALAKDPVYEKVIVNSVWSAAVATIGCLVVGYPTAYGIFRAPRRLRAFVLGALMFSFAVGTVPRTFSWLVILGDHGLISSIYRVVSGHAMPVKLLYNQTGVVIGMIHVMLPYMILILLGSMTRVNPRLVPAARTLGANARRAFFEVFLPLTLPGILAGAMLVFIYSLGFYIVPAVLGGASQTTVVMEIASLTMQSGIWGMGASLSVLVIVVSIAGASGYVRITGLGNLASNS
jgi:putative spermidine/putrescine transport system permease protein